jgi:hypothetical protein
MKALSYLSIIGGLALTVGALVPHAQARPTHLALMQFQYRLRDDKVLRTASCLVCHTERNGGDGWNAFGQRLRDVYFKEAEKKFPVALYYVLTEDQDSDKDGYTNLVEVYAKTLPGDPKSFPSAKPEEYQAQIDELGGVDVLFSPRTPGTEDPLTVPLPTLPGTPSTPPPTTPTTTTNPKPPTTPTTPATPTTPSTPKTEFMLYNDALSPLIANYSYGVSINLSNATPTHNGQYSCAVTYITGWGALSMSVGSLKSADYSNLSFWAYGGKGGTRLNVSVQSPKGEGARVPVTLPEGVWTQVKLSMLELSAPETIGTVNIQNGISTSQPTFYVDDIRLEPKK